MKIVRDIFLNNWGLKITSILLAFILWLLVRGDSGTGIITIPLEIRNIPRNMEITSDRPSTVEATVRGSISNMWFGQPVPTCVIDLNDAEEGERIIPLGPENIRFPRASGVEVIGVRPPRLRLMLERTTSKEVPIVMVHEGEPAPGFEIYSISVNPPTTVITGPRSRVEPVREVSTERISVSGQQESLRALANLNIRDSLIHTSPARPVAVTVEIGVRRRIQTITQVPVVPDDPSLVVLPPQVTLRVLVPITFRGNLTRAEFAATISTRDLDPGLRSASVKPDVNLANPLDPAIRVKEIIPPSVTIRRGGKS